MPRLYFVSVLFSVREAVKTHIVPGPDQFRIFVFQFLFPRPQGKHRGCISLFRSFSASPRSWHGRARSWAPKLASYEASPQLFSRHVFKEIYFHGGVFVLFWSSTVKSEFIYRDSCVIFQRVLRVSPLRVSSLQLCMDERFPDTVRLPKRILSLEKVALRAAHVNQSFFRP